jgi:hypothetical protein
MDMTIERAVVLLIIVVIIIVAVKFLLGLV